MAYLACRRGDLERAGRWLRETRHRHATGPARIDVLAVDAWLARRNGKWRDLARVLDQLADAGGAPLVAEGLDLLAAELARPALDPRAPEPGNARRHLAPYLRASLPSSLSSFTAAHPEQPEPRPPVRAPRPGESLPFRVERNTSALRIQWRALSGTPAYEGPYELATDMAALPHEPGLMVSEPEELRRRLIVEAEDPMVLWRLSHTLFNEGMAAEVSLVPGRTAISVALSEPRVGPVAALLTRLLRHGQVRRLGLRVGGARRELDVTDAAEAEQILAMLLREGRRPSP
ncbi:hypothetical protein [Streptomyces sp. P9-2]|uniref:hypothetical protein n=1 Tax=Streptomyces sp. P9-2 TaxID=3423201 RepID=UPI003F7455D0